MASINTAKYFGLSGLGAITPGFKADFNLLEDLESFRISEVFLNGKQITAPAEVGYNKKTLSRADHSNQIITPPIFENTMHIKPPYDTNKLTIPKRPSKSLLRVIGVIPGQIITENRIIEAKCDNMYVIADNNRNIAKLAVIERHHRTGNVGLGFVQGLGLERGAIASSVAHDSHNLIAAE
jgi:adenine deaminase